MFCSQFDTNLTPIPWSISTSFNNFSNNAFAKKPISRFSSMKTNRLNKNRLCSLVGTIFKLEEGSYLMKKIS